MDLEAIILNEIPDLERQILHDFTNIKKQTKLKQTNRCSYQREEGRVKWIKGVYHMMTQIETRLFVVSTRNVYRC